MATMAIHLRKLRLGVRRRRGEAENILEAEFEREALGSERLRVLALLIVIATGLSLTLISPAFISEEVARFFHGEAGTFIRWRVGVLCVLVMYLVAERVRLNRFVKRGQKPPTFYRYFSAFVETSFPTVE